MAVKQVHRSRSNGRSYKKWVIDVIVHRPNGKSARIRRDCPKGIDTKKKAQKWERELVRKLEGTNRPVRAPTVEAFIPTYLKGCAARGLKESTVDGKLKILEKHLIPLFGSREVDSFSTADLAYLRTSLIGRRPQTCNNIIATLTGLIRYAEELGLAAHVPKAKYVKGSTDVPPHYTDNEYETLISQASGPDLAITLLGGEAGLRNGEIRGLKWEDVQAGRIIVRRSLCGMKESTTKNNRWRQVPLTQRLKTCLKGLPKDDEWVIAGPISQTAMARRLKALKESAGIEKKGSCHILRHTFCTRLVARGVSLRVVKDLAGHADLRTTLKYAHIDEAALRQGIAALDG